MSYQDTLRSQMLSFISIIQWAQIVADANFHTEHRVKNKSQNVYRTDIHALYHTL